MTLPPGFHREGETLSTETVCKLHKSIYGLKQASREWFFKFSQAIIGEGFTQSNADHSLFVKTNGENFIALLVYVDDIVIASNNDKSVANLKVLLDKRFKLKDLGQLKYFLGLEVARSDKGISVS